MRIETWKTGKEVGLESSQSFEMQKDKQNQDKGELYRQLIWTQKPISPMQIYIWMTSQVEGFHNGKKTEDNSIKSLPR